MSEPESFLVRWTRLKRDAERREAEKKAQTDSAPTPSRSVEGTPTEPPASAAGTEPAVDLSALPPIDAITATTDVRAYLAPGVPAELTRAALRRAWLADPTIRDFIGIAENQWDFNDPNGIPGFGPLEDAGRLVAQLLGDAQGPVAPPADVPVPEVPQAMVAPHTPATIGESAPATDGQPEPASPCETNMPAGAPIVAAQADRVQPSRIAVLRGHGTALPK